MSRTEAVLEQINALTPAEREAVFQELARRRERVEHRKAALDEVRGKLAGVWSGQDAQDYINQERANDRF